MSEELAESELLELLGRGEVEVVGRFADSSNATLLVTVRGAGLELQGVYKPEAGERPLWDFPRGLWRREVAAYHLDRLVGLGQVPPTASREEAPHGPGSLQLYREPDDGEHYLTLVGTAQHDEAFRRLAAFDVLANNADRKSGHVFVSGGQVVAIDHGLCFHEATKLRTVIWEFAGEAVDGAILEAAQRLAGGALDELDGLLYPGEVEALAGRAVELAELGALPDPEEREGWPPYPWPLI